MVPGSANAALRLFSVSVARSIVATMSSPGRVGAELSEKSLQA